MVCPPHCSVYWTQTPTPVITNLTPPTNYLAVFQNVTNITATNSTMDLAQLPGNVMYPYGLATTGGLAIPFFLMFFGYYYSLWISHGNLRLACIVGLLFGSMFLFGAAGGMGVEFPDVIVPLAYGAIAASLAGFVMSTWKNV